MDILEKLNDMQKEAVLYNDGPLLIIAGAGSGKTRVITYKIAYLIKEKGVSPYNILAVTFTNKAAKEMKGRVEELIGTSGVQISTFHSFGLKVLLQNYNHLGYENNFTILDSDDQTMVIKKIMKEFNIDPKKFSPRAIKSSISGAKNEMIEPEEYSKFVNTEYEELVLKVYKKYKSDLKKSNCMDFDDLLGLPIELFTKFPNILKEYQERYKYILIDEYQDTNKVQYLLAKMISAKYKQISVVGDDSQSIYSFRGADYHNILNFENDYENARTIMLEQNYRSTTNILTAANNVIKNNKKRKDKKLWSDNGEGNKIKYYRAFDERDEVFYVIREIKQLIDKNVDPSEICVLYRTNAQSRICEEEFLKVNIPFRILGSFYFYSRKEVKDLISYLKLLVNTKDNISLTRVINSPKRGIGNKTVGNLAAQAEKEDKSIYEVLDDSKASEFKEIIEKLLNKKETSTLTELIDHVLELSGLRKSLKDEKSLEADIRLENLEEFKSITRSYEEREGEANLEDFLNEITLVADKEEHKEDNNGVTFMTMHSSKGLEFKAVFVIGVEEGLFPHFGAINEDSEVEEERRLCYVAITRAKEILYIINARRRMLFGKDQVNLPSRFIKEIGEEYLESKEKKHIDKEKMLVDEYRDFNVGDHIKHEKYGIGVIVKTDKSLITVAFPHEVGIKQLMKNHKSIQKI